MPSRPIVSVIIPVFNEEPVVRDALSMIDDRLSADFSSHEILVIESGSDDGSAEICDEIVRERPAIRVIHEGVRAGFGSAVRLGYASATGDALCLATIDHAYPIEILATAIPLLAEHDAILSFRPTDPRGSWRRLQSIVFNSLVRLILGIKARHVNSAFKLYRREVIQSLPLISKGWFIDAEIVCRLERGGLRLAEIPVPMLERPAGKSSVSWNAPFKILGEMIRFRRKLREEEKQS